MHRLGSARSIELTLEGLKSGDPIVRQDAREKLVSQGNTAVPMLNDLLSAREDQIRWEVAKALGEISGPEAIRALARVLSDGNRDVRWVAAEGFIAAGEVATEPLLHELIMHSGLVWVREAGIRVIDANLRSSKAEYLHPVLSALKGRVPIFEVPLAAYEALVELHRSRLNLDRLANSPA